MYRILGGGAAVLMAVSMAAPPADAQQRTALGVLVDDRAHHVGVEELERPAAVTEPPLVSSSLPPRACTTPVEIHELADENSPRRDPFVEASNVSDVELASESSRRRT